MSKQIPQTHPYAIERPNLIPAQRYYDAQFYALECERLWPRVWQMACRLEEIPKPGDFVVYDILDQSVIITRVDEKTVRAYHNACRHRGVQLVRDRGHCAGVFTCPFHGWQFGLDGKCRTRLLDAPVRARVAASRRLAAARMPARTVGRLRLHQF